MAVILCFLQRLVIKDGRWDIYNISNVNKLVERLFESLKDKSLLIFTSSTLIVNREGLVTIQGSGLEKNGVRRSNKRQTFQTQATAASAAAAAFTAIAADWTTSEAAVIAVPLAVRVPI